MRIGEGNYQRSFRRIVLVIEVEHRGDCPLSVFGKSVALFLVESISVFIDPTIEKMQHRSDLGRGFFNQIQGQPDDIEAS